MRELGIIAACAHVVLIGCGSPGATAPPEVPGFDEIQGRIFARSCGLTACHAEGRGAGGLSLIGPAAYDDLIGRPANERPGEVRVVVGDADRSYLIQKLEGRGAVRPMPPNSPLPRAEIDEIAAWIDGGAPRTRGGPTHRTEQEQNSAAVNDFPNPPALEPGQRAFIAAKAMIIPAGTERQFCHYLPAENEEFFVRGLRAYQGVHGHHANLFKRQGGPIEPAIEDCSDAEGMIGLLPVLVPSQGGVAELPEGMAVRVATGTQLVVQSHYVNVTSRPLRVRDTIVVQMSEPSEVQTEIGNVAVANFDFTLAPNAKGQVVRAACPISRPITVTSLRAHMHEHGVSILVEHEKVSGERISLFEIDPWQPEFRDLLPGVSFHEKPLRLEAGDYLTVECTFDNPSDTAIQFPTEMCASFGYFHPVTPEEPQFICFVLDSPTTPNP
ncbi:MAG: hypothetical protein P8R42_11380 [Candidatus Binatia bacterium]|nr:hypothetical protein [Candidatus Binatia bacterium]